MILVLMSQHLIPIILAYFSNNLILYKRGTPNMKDLIWNKQVKLYHTDGKKNPADILTKTLG